MAHQLLQIVALIGLFIFCANCCENVELNKINVQLIDNVDKFRQENPFVRAVIEPKILYTVGQRQYGDNIVHSVAGYRNWSTPLTITYPSSGVGRTVTYVDIVIQTQVLGKGNVTYGGIGQRSIGVQIKATSSEYYIYDARVWGL